MSLAPVHDVHMALARPGLSPLERIVYVHAVIAPGGYALAALSGPNLVSDQAVAVAVKHLVKKQIIKPAKPLDGFINLEAV